MPRASTGQAADRAHPQTGPAAAPPPRAPAQLPTARQRPAESQSRVPAAADISLPASSSSSSRRQHRPARPAPRGIRPVCHLRQSKAELPHSPAPKRKRARPCSRTSSNPQHPFRDGYLPPPIPAHRGPVPGGAFQQSGVGGSGSGPVHLYRDSHRNSGSGVAGSKPVAGTWREC